MKLLILFMLFLGGCTTSSVSPTINNSSLAFPPKTAPNPIELESHPEYPLAASLYNPAWEMFLYIIFGIVFFCMLPSLLVYICERWKPFWCVDPDNKKDLTEEEE
jgi:hypothetical protein|tara:strand:- start:1206 stop:1520 length:315 start_codon:yes stop_codon:yes gene_type:complete